MSEKRNYTTPAGTISYMSIDRARPNEYKDNRLEYVVKLTFNGTTTEGQAFREFVESVNSNKVTTKNCPEGHYSVSAWSKYQPKVFDADKVELSGDDIPAFPKGSTGTAIMEVQENPAQGTRQGGLYLKGVAILDLEQAEVEYTEGQTATSLKAAIDKAAGA